MAEKYCYSFDEENCTGEYDSPVDAANAAFEDQPNAEHCFVGEAVPAVARIDAEQVIENIQNQDEFLGEWAEDWPGESKLQREELEAGLNKVFEEWMDKHDLKPKFFNVINSKKVPRAETSI